MKAGRVLGFNSRSALVRLLRGFSKLTGSVPSRTLFVAKKCGGAFVARVSKLIGSVPS